MAKKQRREERLNTNRPTKATAPRGGQVEHASPTPGGTADAIDGRYPENPLSDADLGGDEMRSIAQQGGSRGGSNQNGPDREGTRRAREAVAGSDEREQGAHQAGGTDDPIRGSLPEGAEPEDYLGGEKPHKTREEGGTRTHASRKRNEVL